MSSDFAPLRPATADKALYYIGISSFTSQLLDVNILSSNCWKKMHEISKVIITCSVKLYL